MKKINKKAQIAIPLGIILLVILISLAWIFIGVAAIWQVITNFMIGLVGTVLLKFGMGKIKRTKKRK